MHHHHQPYYLALADMFTHRDFESCRGHLSPLRRFTAQAHLTHELLSPRRVPTSAMETKHNEFYTFPPSFLVTKQVGTND